MTAPEPADGGTMPNAIRSVATSIVADVTKAMGSANNGIAMATIAMVEKRLTEVRNEGYEACRHDVIQRVQLQSLVAGNIQWEMCADQLEAEVRELKPE
jgi:hypothetical protein